MHMKFMAAVRSIEPGILRILSLIKGRRYFIGFDQYNATIALQVKHVGIICVKVLTPKANPNPRPRSRVRETSVEVYRVSHKLAFPYRRP